MGRLPRGNGLAEKLLKILHDGQDISESGLTTTPGQTIDDITIVVAKQ